MKKTILILSVLSLGCLLLYLAVRKRENTEPPPRTELEFGRTVEYDYDVPEPGSYHLPSIKIAADGDVVTMDGKPTKLQELLKDRITVLSFIYTRCSDPTACPKATGVLYDLHQISQKDRELADNMQLLTFSFDPDYDTPEVMKRYSRPMQTGQHSAPWRFLTTQSQRQLQPILKAYNQQVDRKKDADDPMGPLSHILRVYLIDRRGQIRNIYSFGMLDPRLLLTDIRTLLIEDR